MLYKTFCRLQQNCAKHRRFYLILLLACLGGILSVGRATLAEKAPEGYSEAAAAAREYLYALAAGDRETLNRLTPNQLEHYYGPSMFKQVPVLSNPRARLHMALIDFEGESTDPCLPKQGTISLVLEDTRKIDKWMVQGIFWKGAAALTINPLKCSATEADRSQEPAVKASALKYLRAWQDNDWQRMQYMTFDWVNHKRVMRSNAIVRSMDLKAFPRPDGSVRVDFTAKVSPRFPIIRILRKTVTGHVYTVKEDGVWKVRGMLAGI
jgi:hypothetical protein